MKETAHLMDGAGEIALVQLGCTPYLDALAFQRRVQRLRQERAVPDTLILTEHPPVITLGSRADTRHLLVEPDTLAARGIELVRVERGGDVTYHGPGQLVAYPVLDLGGHGRDIHRYIRNLEETAIRLLAAYGINGRRNSGTPGVWVDAAKVASVGVSVRRWVTMHGIAINVAPDLSPFSLINPCGLVGMPVTSLARVCGAAVALDEACQRYVHAFERVFGSHLTPVSLDAYA